VPAGLIDEWAQMYSDILTAPGGFARARRDRDKLQACVEIAGHLLPPPEQGAWIKALQESDRPLLISPDAALEHVPFEALLLEGGDSPQFLLDRLPSTGTLYIPSLMIADALERASASPPARGLLTVGNPDLSGFRAVAGLQELADLPDLKLAREESQAAAKSFRSAARPVRQLLGTEATESRFRAAIAQCCPACLHVATHTVEPDSSPGGVRALLLSPGPKGAGDDDGLLEIHEICTLPLRGCELAVLSACKTADGRGVPREMAMSTARAFLVAGARRVVASQWEVEENAGCAFVGDFLDQTAHRSPSGPSYGCAAAVAAARKRLRKDPRWSDPYFWSSFVLIGAAD
jgi:CHAT domain-containing protein